MREIQDLGVLSAGIVAGAALTSVLGFKLVVLVSVATLVSMGITAALIAAWRY